MAKSRVSVIKRIKKRSGKVVAFSQAKITKAILGALKAAGQDNKKLAKKLSDVVVSEMERRFNGKIVPEVEQVQDLIEGELEGRGLDRAHRAFTLYRELHRRLREVTSLVDSDELIEKYLNRSDWRVKENANMTYSLQGLNNHVASIITANYWMNKIYSREIRKAHRSGGIHIHDLASLSAYCTGWDLRDFLMKGFGGVPGKVNSKPPKHLGSALGQLVNFFYTVQGEVAGAVAVSNFDTYMAPFIRYDKLNHKEVKQLMQEFLFNMNVPTRVGFQTPFTNISMDLRPTKTVGEEAVIIGGKVMKSKYKEYQKEIDLINRVFAEVMMEGDAQGRVFTFPIPTYSITKNFDWDNKNLEPVWEMTRKYGVPYFSNFVNSDMDPDDTRSMCPLAGDEKVLIRSSRGRRLEYSSIRNIYEGNSKQKEYEIYANGQFVEGKFGRWRNQQMLRVILANGHEIKMSEEHLNFVWQKGGKVETLKGKDLDTNMYLPYSLNKYKGSGGNYDLGFFVGAFAGDGSFDDDTSVVFSLENNFKKSVISKLKKIAIDYFSAGVSEKQHAKTKLYTLKVHSRAAVGLCRDFVEDKERQKHYRARLFESSLEFRRGVVAGHYATDGGNRHRIYTSSKKMVETLNMLAATMGTTTAIYKDERKGRLGEEPNYAVLIYQLNRAKYGNFWEKHDGKLWVKIKKIESITNKTAYCFEVKNKESMFTIGTTGVLTHNCRLRLDNRVLRKRGGLFAANPLTGSIGVVTINLPRIGYEAKKSSKNSEVAQKEFFAILGKRMDLAKESLMIKRAKLEEFTEKNLYPYCSYYLSDIYKRNKVYWRNHFNTIGINGMNEALLNLMGKTIAEAEGKSFALEVMDYMKDKILIYQKEIGELFNLEATPAEGTSYRFAKLDREKYPDIVCAGKDTPFYTNSTHLPVDATDDIFEALDHQDELQCKYTGGTVMHGFLGESLPITAAVKKLVRKVAENYRLPYFSVTPTFSVCPKHGYLKGEWKYCPKCDKEIGWKK